MSNNTVWKNQWGDFRLGWVVLFRLCVCLLVLAAAAGIITGVIYATQGCLINKGHVGPHISDGCYEFHITEMTFPRFGDEPTFYLRGRILEKGDREYTIRANESLGEQAWSQGVGGTVTVWSKNNHIIKYHIGGTGRSR